MAYSMTGFGRSDGENEDFSIIVEMKAVNHKYLDIQIKSPYYFNYLEEDIKKTIKKYISRGRIDVFIKSTRKVGNTSKIDIDLELAKLINNSLNDLREELKIDGEVSLNNILKYDGVVNVRHEDPDEDSTKIFLVGIVEETSKKLRNMREVEGNNLVDSISIQLRQMESILEQVETKSPLLTEKYRNDLLERLNDIFDEVNKLDNDRINLEVALFAEKSDINEEIVRLKSHINQFDNTVNGNSPIGRKLDFIVQEMNREVNTISSKSNDEDITRNAIELKTIIEKIREQIQNIE